MGTAKKLSLIAGSYLVAAAAGAAAVLLNRLFTAGDDSGMAAFSDLVLFILVAGLLSLPPTWTLRSEEHTSELQSHHESRMPSSA